MTISPSTFGPVVQVHSAEHYEKLIAFAGAVSGWFDPVKGYGEVKFTAVRAACIARNML